MLRKKWINTLVCSLIVSLLGFAATTDAQTDKYKGQSLTLLSWGTGWDEAMTTSKLEFEKRFGVTLKHIGQESTNQGLARLQGQQGKTAVDVWMTVPATVGLARPGLLADIDTSYITDKEDLMPGTISKKYVSCYNYPFGITWRTDLLPNGISKWEDLWDPALKGKIAIPSPGFYQSSFLIVCAYLNGGSEFNIDPGFEKIKQLVPNIEIVFESDAIARNALAQGEVAVTVGGGDYYAFLQGKNVPAKMIAPKPTPLNFDCFAVIKGGNEALAHEFINFMVHPFAQEKTVVEWKCIPVNKKVAPAPELAGAVPKMSDMITVDLSEVNKKQPEWVERWNREVIIK